MVVFDTAVLTLLLWDGAKAPSDPTNGKTVDHCKQRMECLVKQLHESKEVIVIPAPVLSEVLVVTGSEGLQYVHILQKARVFLIEGFGSRAAIELAEMTRTALKAGDKRDGIDAPWERIKLDRQIVAIAKVVGADVLYTNDRTLGTVARRVGLHVTGVHELPLPPEETQISLIDMLEAQEAEDRTEDEPNAEDIESEKAIAGRSQGAASPLP